MATLDMAIEAMKRAATKCGCDASKYTVTEKNIQEAWGDRCIWIVTGPETERAYEFLAAWLRKYVPSQSHEMSHGGITVSWYSIGD